jgi:ABC-type sugar transport system permease subunit
MLLLIGLFVVVPVAVAIFRSFYDWNPGYHSDFVGLANYREVFSSSVVHEIAWNELVFMLGVPLWAGVPLIVALLLYERVPAAGLFRTIFFFPSVLSPVILGLLFRAFFRPDGIVNVTLERIGLGGLQRNWINDPTYVKPVIIVVVMWFTLGFGVVLYSAALSAVQPDLFEAAELDGASWLQRLGYVIVPAILPMFLLNVVFSFATVFLLFGYVYTLTQGGPGYASTTIDYDIYQNSLAYGYFGLGAAEAVCLLVVMVIIIGVTVLAGRRLWR